MYLVVIDIIFTNIIVGEFCYHTTLHGVTNVKRSSQYVDHPLLALISEAKLNKKFDFNE